MITTEPNTDGIFAVVSFTSLKEAKDQTVILRKAGHPFLKHDMCICYALAELTSAEKLQAFIDQGTASSPGWGRMAIHGIRSIRPEVIVTEEAAGATMESAKTKQETIEEITRRLVNFYHPLRIYLFGSEARGEAGPDSDLDFCVVLPDEAPRSLYGPGVRRALLGVGAATDAVRYPLTDFEGRAAHVISSLPATVMREGRLLYDA